MTNNLQDRFREFVENETMIDVRLCDEFLPFIFSEIEQEKKDLINQLLSEAPEDKELLPDYLYMGKFKEPKDEGFNESNNQWRTLLENKLSKGIIINK